MASTIKGITVEIGGNTTELSKAIKDVNSTANSLQTELKAVDKLLKFDSSNITLCNQKEELLTKAVEATKEKLDILKEAEQQVQQQFEAGEVSEEQYRALERQIAQTEIQLGTYESQLNELNSTDAEVADSTEDITDSAEDLEEAVDDAGEAAEDADGKFDTWKVTLGNLAADAIEAVIGKVKDLVGQVIELGENFTSSMSNLQAVSGATDDELASLEETARKYGASTVFSASECSDALGYMALAGWDVQEMTDALPGVLNLAAASGMELAEASDMCTDYLSAFSMGAEDATYMADMLATAQANSNTTAAALGEAYKNCAANLNASGQDIETTTSLLEAMANQGLKGGEAGTALNAIIRDITSNMEDGKIAIGDTAVAVTDAEGNFRDLTDIIKDVDAATQGMGDAEKAAALQATFTSDSTKGLNLILNEGVDNIAEYEEQLRNCDGAAGEMADTMNDNLAGDMKEMQSATEELGLSLYEKLEEPLRSGTQFITNTVIPAVQAIIDNLPTVATIIGGVTAAIIAFKVAALSAKLAEEGLTIATKAQQVAQSLLNAVMSANPIGLIILAITALIAIFITLWNNCEGFRNFWLGLWENVQTAFQAAMDFLQPLIESLKQWFIDAWDAIKAVWDFVQPYFQAIWDAIQIIFSVVVDVLGGYFQMAWEVIKAVWDVVTGYFQAIWDTIKGIFAVVQAVLQGDFQGAWDAIKGIVGTWVAYFQSVWDNIKKVFSAVVTFFSSTFSSAWSAVKNAFSGFVSFFQGLWDKIKSTFSNLGTSIANAIGGAVKSGINGVISMIQNTINSAIGVINGAIGLINKIPGVSVGKVSTLSLPRLAKGGQLREGEAMVAEAGPELLQMVNGKAIVTPLTDNAKNRNIDEVLGSRGNTFTQNVNITSSKELSPSETARQTRNATRQMILALQRG